VNYRDTPSIVQAVLANLEFAAQAEQARAVRYGADGLSEAQARHDGASAAYLQAIRLVRTEFQGLQEAIPDVSSP
jgi:hypothetical protein